MRPTFLAAAADPTARLPTGLDVRCVSRRDVPFLYGEIYQRRCYMQHGIKLQPGGTVIDCGANIGLFSMLAAEELGPEGLVLACEPLLPTFECLEHNAAAHREWWSQREQDQGAAAAQGAAALASQQQRGRQPPARIVALNVGVGSGQQATATFTFYPRAAGWSSMRPEERGVQEDMGAFLDAALSSPEAAAAAGLDPATAALGRALRLLAPRWAFDAVRRRAVGGMLCGARTVACPLLSVSQLIERYQLPAVDLLKVDVERAELEVLRGLEDRHWPLVRQAALEVHAEDLQDVLELLRGRAAFPSVVVEQEAALAGTSLHAVYCRR